MSDDDEEIIRVYGPSECERRRGECLRDVIVPQVEALFRKHPQFQSAVLSVAQYWNDEATDAVHGHLAMSLSLEPDIEHFYAESVRLWHVEDDHSAEGMREHAASQWLVEGVRAFEPRGEPYYREGYVGWDDNGEAVPLFAAFCTECANQEMAVGEAYSPYAIIRREPAGAAPSIEVIAKVIRPWLDGVKPVWWRS